MLLKVYKSSDSNNILRKKCLPLSIADIKYYSNTSDNMVETCITLEGLGLSAPQIGFNIRLCICKIGDTHVAMFNPEILERSEELTDSIEGCLSLNGDKQYLMKRNKSVIVQYTDKYGVNNVLNLTDLDALVVQHELDHLEGILIDKNGERIYHDKQ